MRKRHASFLHAGAPSEPQRIHTPDISGGIGGPTDVNIQPANVSLPQRCLHSLLSRARQKNTQMYNEYTAHALHVAALCTYIMQ